MVSDVYHAAELILISGAGISMYPGDRVIARSLLGFSSDRKSIYDFSAAQNWCTIPYFFSVASCEYYFTYWGSSAGGLLS
jgi:hypothetical protein